MVYTFRYNIIANVYRTVMIAITKLLAEARRSFYSIIALSLSSPLFCTGTEPLRNVYPSQFQ